MSETRWITPRHPAVRLALVTLGLAPVVAAILIGFSRLRRDTPEWVYWQAELVVVIALQYAYLVTACLATVGAFALGGLFLMRRGHRESQPGVSRGLLLSITLLCGLAASEAVCAGWLSRAHRFTPIPDGGLAAGEQSDPTLRFAQPPERIELRSEFPDPPGDRQIDLVVMGESSAEGVPYNRWLSIGKIVAWKLQQAIPARPIHLNVIARSGDTLEKQHLILSNLERRPDALIIYCGHNEFYSRLWWARTSTTTGSIHVPATGTRSERRSSGFRPLPPCCEKRPIDAESRFRPP